VTPAGWISASLLTLTLPFAIGSSQQADPPRVRPSQRGSVSQRIADTTITIDYSRPVARGRELFGKLVPWGRIWCPGADDATTIQVTSGVKVEGKDLPAGKYSLWAEPNPERWTLIFNRDHAVWHTRYPEGRDQLRAVVTPRSGSDMETLAFYFPVVDGRKAELVLHWGTVVVPLGLEVP
jgi:hypothetical protein